MSVIFIFWGISLVIGLLTLFASPLEKKLDKLEKCLLDYANSNNEK
ncbi:MULTISPECIES: hypothetical protein [Vibrio]|uniref:Uncharacterized protein n=1 Tax=Vibrio rumoiensis TaxID=76258 RepID=A0ABW7J0N2_9VIBR|nr:MULTISPECIES: hypothetical protein [Vibrio]